MKIAADQKNVADLSHRRRSTAATDTIDVSVVIPAYQCSGTIARALDSVFAQTFLRYEVIVVNDGSPDTPLLRRILAPYLGRIRYIQQENRGPSGARNAGIHRAEGSYIAFLDSDDFWLPHHLENQVKLLRSDQGLGLVYANPLLLEGTTPIGAAFDLSPQESAVTFDSLLREDSRIGTSSTVASRTEIIKAGCFDENMRRCEDFDLWLRMAYSGTRMAYSSEVQLWHHCCNGLSSDRMLMRRARIEAYEKTLRLLPLTVIQRRIVLRKIALNHADYQVDVAKLALLTKNYAEAVLAAERANDLLDSWKLRLALTGLRAAPALFSHSYRAYEHVLNVRNRGLNTWRMKHLQSATITPRRLPA